MEAVKGVGAGSALKLRGPRRNQTLSPETAGIIPEGRERGLSLCKQALWIDPSRSRRGSSAALGTRSPLRWVLVEKLKRV